jgi:hypothetical protein
LIKLKELLQHEIDEGLVNWDKLEEKVHAGIETIHNFNSGKISNSGTKMQKLENALVFPLKRGGVSYAVKVLCPTLQHCQIVCSGLLNGFYVDGKPVFPKEQG